MKENVITIRNSTEHHIEAQKWCMDNISIDSRFFLFGHWYCDQNWSVPAHHKSSITYFFKNEDDAVMFKLRFA